MNKNVDIQYIRRLIDKFYQGESSPAEEQVLAMYFCESSDAEIPQDLLGDAQVFRSLNSMQQNDCIVPNDLLGKLEAVTKDLGLPLKNEELSAPISKGERQKRKPLYIRISSMAAAACLLWGIITFLHHTPQQPFPSSGLTARTDAEVANHNEAEVTDTVSAPATILTEQTKSIPIYLAQVEPRPKASRQSAAVPTGSTVMSSEDTSDDFIEITDPEEARQIMENIRNLLAANFSESEKAISTISTSIESYKKITKTILQ